MHENNDISVISESPDGSYHYLKECKSKINNRFNPYVRNINNNRFECLSYDDQYLEILFNNKLIIISRNDYDLAIEIEHQANIVRLFCLVDYTFNLFNFYINYYFYIGNLIIALISLSGFMATYTFNKVGILIYLIYQYIQLLLKTVIVMCYILNIFEYNLNIISYNETKVFYENFKIINYKSYYFNENFNFLYLFLIFSYTILQIFITYYVHSFYKIIPKVNNLYLSHSLI